MAKKKLPAEPPPSTPPQSYEATLVGGASGAVAKGDPLTQAQAEARRKAGLDVVVCGADLGANRRLAQSIEIGANGKVKRCIPHRGAGPRALPHFQPASRPPEGHTFYETPHRKASG